MLDLSGLEEAQNSLYEEVRKLFGEMDPNAPDYWSRIETFKILISNGFTIENIDSLHGNDFLLYKDGILVGSCEAKSLNGKNGRVTISRRLTSGIINRFLNEVDYISLLVYKRRKAVRVILLNKEHIIHHLLKWKKNKVTTGTISLDLFLKKGYDYKIKTAELNKKKHKRSSREYIKKKIKKED